MIQLVLIFIVLFIIWWYNVSRLPKTFPPGPRFPLPIIGDSLAVGSKITEGFQRLKSKYGSVIGLYLGPNKTVIINDFDLLNELLFKDEFSYRPHLEIALFLRGGFSVGKSVPGLLFSNKNTWQEQRRFALSTLRDFGFGKKAMEEMIDEDIHEFMKYIIDEFDTRPIDMTFNFQVVVLNSLWKIISGEELHYKNERFLYLVTILDDMFREQGSTFGNIAMFYPKFYEILSSLNLILTTKACHKILKFCDESIAKHFETYQEDNVRDFIDCYIKQTVANESKLKSSFNNDIGKLNLRNDLFDLFIAGSETTSTTLSWGMLFMIAFPDIQQNVQNELDKVIGRSRLPKVADRTNLPFTEAVIHEIQRLGNILPLGVFHAVGKEVKVQEYTIPAGTQIMTDLSSIHLNPEYFPEPKKFDPTRYMNESGQFVPNKYVIPFGVGKRRCLGETLAKMTLFKIFTSLLHRFNVLPGDEKTVIDLEPDVKFTNAPKPFTVRFIQR